MSAPESSYIYKIRFHVDFSPQNIAIDSPNYLPLTITLRKGNLEVHRSPVVVKAHPTLFNCLFNSVKPRMLFPVSSHHALSILHNDFFLTTLLFLFGILINISH